MTDNVKKFIEALIDVRDHAIEAEDGALRFFREVDRVGPVSTRLRKAHESGDIDSFVKMFIADTVDTAIFYLLHKIDYGELPLNLNGSDLSKEGEGELAGWFEAEWKYTISKQRTYPDYPSSNIGRSTTQKLVTRS